MTTQSKRMPFAIAGIVGCCAIILLAAIFAGGVYFFVVRGQFPTIGQRAIGGEIKDPIVTMLVAASIDDKGQVVDPKFTFDATQPQMTVIVQAGKVTNAPLDLVWYQVTDAGDQKLFEHHVQVDAYERAYSIGKNPGGTLAEGTYKVVATLGGQTKSVEFDVQQKAGQPATGGAPVSTQQGKPPEDGGSGKRASPVSSVAPSSSGCTINLLNMYGENDVSTVAPYIEIGVQSTCPGVVVVTATAQGSRQIGTLSGVGFTSFIVDPCDLEGGKDLPGAKVQFDAIETTGNSGEAIKVITLGEDTLAPRVLLDTIPTHGQKVKAGQKIDITVTAQEKRCCDGPWQTGVKVIHVRETQAGGGEEFFTWSNPDGLPKPCDLQRLEHKEHTSYTVPKDPPPLIEICASADDWNKSGPETCYRYPTGKIWKGTVHATASVFYTAPNFISPTYTGTYDGKLTLSEGSDGAIKGHSQVTGSGCQYRSAVAETSISFDVTGKNTGKQLELQIVASTYHTNGDFSCGFGLGWVASNTSSSPFAIIPIIRPGVAQGRWHGEHIGSSTTHQTADYEFNLTAQ